MRGFIFIIFNKYLNKIFLLNIYYYICFMIDRKLRRSNGMYHRHYNKKADIAVKQYCKHPVHGKFTRMIRSDGAEFIIPKKGWPTTEGTKPNCPYNTQKRRMIRSKHIDYKEIILQSKILFEVRAM